jgi:hypothetical protein
MIFALMLMSLHGLLLQSLPVLPISPLPWFLVSMIVALCVILAAALLYMVAPVFNSPAMQQWSRFQIYEVLLSIGLIFLFLVVVKLFFLNPAPAFASVGLVPQGCTTANTIFGLSACDLAQFNTASYNIAYYIWAFSFFKGVIPRSSLSIQPFTNEGTGFEFIFTLPNVLDAANTQFLNYILDAILTFLLVSQIQLVILSSSVLLLSFFFSVGLIGRLFGVSRSFGGAMIAFGLGLGLVYPLLIGVTYGYIDVASNAYCIGSVLCSATNSAMTFGTAFLNIFVAPFNALLFLFSGTTTPAQAVLASFATVFDEIGYVLAGLVVMPIINIIIVNIFVVDFSRAVGEEMSFSMLFRGVV